MKKLSLRVIAAVLSLLVALSCSVSAFAAEGRYGDVNADGKVNSTDALSVLKHAVGSSYLAEEYLFWADVNADTKINSTDALEILQYAVGKITRFSAEIAIAKPETKDEILALYAETISKAREEIPAYKIKTTTEVFDIEIGTSGPISLMYKPSDLEQMKQDMMTTDVTTNVFRQGTQSALANLPLDSVITDTSKYKSIKCTVLTDGNYQLDISFKDEKNPGSATPIVKMLGLPDYAAFKASLEDSTENTIVIPTENGDVTIELEVTVNSLEYKNASVSCVVSSTTGEIVSLKVAVDIKNDVKTDLGLLGSMTTVQSVKNTLEYSNFIY